MELLDESLVIERVRSLLGCCCCCVIFVRGNKGGVDNSSTIEVCLFELFAILLSANKDLSFEVGIFESNTGIPSLLLISV